MNVDNLSKKKYFLPCMTTNNQMFTINLHPFVDAKEVTGFF